MSGPMGGHGGSGGGSGATRGPAGMGGPAAVVRVAVAHGRWADGRHAMPAEKAGTSRAPSGVCGRAPARAQADRFRFGCRAPQHRRTVFGPKIMGNASTS